MFILQGGSASHSHGFHPWYVRPSTFGSVASSSSTSTYGEGASQVSVCVAGGGSEARSAPAAPGSERWRAVRDDQDLELIVFVDFVPVRNWTDYKPKIVRIIPQTQVFNDGSTPRTLFDFPH